MDKLIAKITQNSQKKKKVKNRSLPITLQSNPNSKLWTKRIVMLKLKWKFPPTAGDLQPSATFQKTNPEENSNKNAKTKGLKSTESTANMNKISRNTDH